MPLAGSQPAIPECEQPQTHVLNRAATKICHAGSVRVSMLLKSRASPDMLPFSFCNKKRLAIRHMNRPIFLTTLSIPSYDIGKVGRAKDFSVPPRAVCMVMSQCEFCVYARGGTLSNHCQFVGLHTLLSVYCADC
jgi:hypothetical protein